MFTLYSEERALITFIYDVQGGRVGKALQKFQTFYIGILLSENEIVARVPAFQFVEGRQDMVGQQ